MQISPASQQSFARSLDRASNSNAVFTHALSHICKYADWDYGEVWIPSTDDTMLELHSSCYISGDRTPAEMRALEQFRICSKGLFFLMDVGLPGRVWLMQRAEWLTNVATESERVFLRHHIAKAFGVKSGFGVPVLGRDRVVAVLVFFTLDFRQADKHLIEQIITLTASISQKLEALMERGVEIGAIV